MDSITQGILGAAAAQAVLSRRMPRRAWLVGAVGGMAADLDILIRSATDPTVGWIFHRHFTHSLIFIPIGGLITALPFLWTKRFRDYRLEVILASIIGYATHGLLDSFTSYGTQLLWPFSDWRVAWDWIGIIDPIYSITLLVGVIWTARTQRPRAARVALLLSSLYLCFGGWQHHRAAETQRQLAAIRGHQIEHSRVMPAPGWLRFWRSVYISDGRMYSDGIHTRYFQSPLVLEGDLADVTTLDDLPPAAQSNEEAKRQFTIFRWFADGLIAPVEEDANAFGDMRITGTVEGWTPLWGLQFDAATGAPSRWNPGPGRGRDADRAIRSLIFADPNYKPLSAFRPANAP